MRLVQVDMVVERERELSEVIGECAGDGERDGDVGDDAEIRDVECSWYVLLKRYVHRVLSPAGIFLCHIILYYITISSVD